MEDEIFDDNYNEEMASTIEGTQIDGSSIPDLVRGTSSTEPTIEELIEQLNAIIIKVHIQKKTDPKAGDYSFHFTTESNAWTWDYVGVDTGVMPYISTSSKKFNTLAECIQHLISCITDAMYDAYISQ